MQYVWQHGLWIPGDLRTVDGRRVRVIDRGLLNRDAGPDFFNAKVEIGGRLWAGNVEIHVRASDWHRHGHDADPAYSSVILHVVGRDDARISRPGGGGEIPQIVMDCAPDFHSRYKEMVFGTGPLVCASELPSVPSIYVSDWLASLALGRLQRKAARVRSLVDEVFEGNWRAAVYVTLARALGFGVNSDAFERLARLVPLKSLMKHSDSIDTVEGLLFGQAGLIPEPGALGEPDSLDELYASTLRREYAFMRLKFGIAPPAAPLGWKMARMRPPNFPHRRIAALASMVVPSFELGYRIMDVASFDDAAALFSMPLRGYWSHHYSFGTPASGSPAAFGASAINTLIINVVAPVQYAYGEMYGHEDMMSRAVNLLDAMKPESNSIIRLFASAGIPCRSALESQALIELRREYCEPRKCLYCRLGHRLLAAKVKP